LYDWTSTSYPGSDGLTRRPCSELEKARQSATVGGLTAVVVEVGGEVVAVAVEVVELPPGCVVEVVEELEPVVLHAPRTAAPSAASPASLRKVRRRTARSC